MRGYEDLEDDMGENFFIPNEDGGMIAIPKYDDDGGARNKKIIISADGKAQLVYRKMTQRK